MLKKNVEELLILLEQAQEKQDYANVAECYLQLGKIYKKEGKISKALYYLNRFDNLVGGDDSIDANLSKQSWQNFCMELVILVFSVAFFS